MSEREVFIAKELGSEIKSDHLIRNLFKNLNKFDRVIMNFEDVNVISLSPAYEYVLQRVAAEFEIVEINVPENIQGIFDIVISFHNLNTVAVKQELSEIENWPDMKYKFSDFTAEGKRRDVNKISQELRAKQEELVQVNYALDAQKLGFYDPEYVSKNYGDFKDKLNLIRKKQKELVLIIKLL